MEEHMSLTNYVAARTPAVEAALSALRAEAGSRHAAWTTIAFTASTTTGTPLAEVDMTVSGGPLGGGQQVTPTDKECDLLRTIANEQLEHDPRISSFEITMVWNEPGETLEVYREGAGEGLSELERFLEGEVLPTPRLAHLASMPMYDGARLNSSIVAEAGGLDMAAAKRLLGAEGEEARLRAEHKLALAAASAFTKPATLLQFGPMLELTRAWRPESVVGEPKSGAVAMPVMLAAAQDSLAGLVRDAIPAMYEDLAFDLVQSRFRR